jgi:hypothetical protein
LRHEKTYPHPDCFAFLFAGSACGVRTGSDHNGAYHRSCGHPATGGVYCGASNGGASDGCANNGCANFSANRPAERPTYPRANH